MSRAGTLWLSFDGARAKRAAAAGATSVLFVRDAFIEKSLNTYGAIEMQRCRFHLETTMVSMLDTEIVVLLESDSVFHADRIHVTGEYRHYLVANRQRMEMRVTNSLLEHTATSLGATDTTAPGSTFVFSSVAAQYGGD